MSDIHFSSDAPPTRKFPRSLLSTTLQSDKKETPTDTKNCPLTGERARWYGSETAHPAHYGLARCARQKRGGKCDAAWI